MATKTKTKATDSPKPATVKKKATMSDRHTFTVPAANLSRLIAVAKEGAIESMKPAAKTSGKVEVTFRGTSEELFELGRKMTQTETLR